MICSHEEYLKQREQSLVDFYKLRLEPVLCPEVISLSSGTPFEPSDDSKVLGKTLAFLSYSFILRLCDLEADLYA
jgi:hypothetical protein